MSVNYPLLDAAAAAPLAPRRTFGNDEHFVDGGQFGAQSRHLRADSTEERGLFGRGLFIEGLFAGVMYRSLRMLHERALHSTRRAVLDLLASGLSRRTGPPVKLH